MTFGSFALILTGVLLNAFAQLLLKAGTNTLGVISPTVANALPLAGSIATNPHFLGGFACYGVSVLVWIVALSRVPVSIAYPMLSIGYVVNALAAGYLFGEALTGGRWLGIGFIIIGVVLLARS
ncbi:MAG: 4-amino-4-deoxy-L-arabinose transferase [Candidatus Competibacteraceae bacterium]|nr:4-amino-4-deoxy-L-arabinose transferase [Candidatus Competibacteraceae bacterium]HRY16521.1 4-amino-4-deoxy-L-arabinose transferase [Candidatus Competibacteraceae bacterium]